MASPAFVPPPLRKVTEGYFKVPNSFVENQHLLKTPAARALALIVFRAESEPNGIRTISNRRWESWTGFKDRQKEYAIKELREFGLDIQGRGDTAKFSWDWSRWNQAIKTPNPDHKSPNYRAKERTAKPGAKVHEDCHEHGCARLRECQAENSTNPQSPFLVTSIAQHSAQTVMEATEKAWAMTMAALCSFFPLVGALFLARLLQVVRGVFPSITDEELAAAIYRAHFAEQFSPKAFLVTVPNTIIKIRREKKAALEKQLASDGSDLPILLPGMERAQKSYDNTLAILKEMRKGKDDDHS